MNRPRLFKGSGPVSELMEIYELSRHGVPFFEETLTGNIVSFQGNGSTVRNLSVAIDPVQDLHGYSNPWPSGGGKNLIPMTLEQLKAQNIGGIWDGNKYTFNSLDFTVLTNATGAVVGIEVSGTPSANTIFHVYDTVTLENGESYILNGCPPGGSGSTYRQVYLAETNVGEYGSGANITGDNNTHVLVIIVSAGAQINKTFYPMIRLASVDDPSFAPYSNVCPISGWMGANIYLESVYDPTAEPKISVAWQTEAGTVYGGSLNVTAGALASEWGNIASYNGEALPGEWISSEDVYVPGGTPTTGAQVIYRLSAPVAYKLTPQEEVQTLSGSNDLWADTGNVTVTCMVKKES